MRSDWKKTTIDEVCSRIYSGGTPSTKEPKYWNGDINWLSSGETRNKFIYGTERKITRLGVEESSTQLALKDSVVIATAGQGYTRGQASFLKIDTYVNQSVLVFEADTQVIEPLFLYYNLSNRYEELRQLSDGTSTRGGLSGWIVKRMDIDLPSLSLQKKIVDILYDIDQKIECNTAINKNLQEQAQAIFAYLFSDHPYHLGSLSQIADVIMGQSPRGESYNETKSGALFFQGRADFGFRFPTPRLYTTEPKRMAQAGDVLLSVRAPVGDLNIALEPCCIGRGIAAIRSIDEHPSFLFYCLLSQKDQFDVFNGEGTVFGSINSNALKSMEVRIPHKKLLNHFEEIVAPIDTVIRVISEEILYLMTLRDTLLPRLISGELDVSNIEL